MYKLRRGKQQVRRERDMGTGGGCEKTRRKEISRRFGCALKDLRAAVVGQRSDCLNVTTVDGTEVC
jgi:hypothetical protein